MTSQVFSVHNPLKIYDNKEKTKKQISQLRLVQLTLELALSCQKYFQTNKSTFSLFSLPSTYRQLLTVGLSVFFPFPA